MSVIYVVHMLYVFCLVLMLGELLYSCKLSFFLLWLHVVMTSWSDVCSVITCWKIKRKFLSNGSLSTMQIVSISILKFTSA